MQSRNNRNVFLTVISVVAIALGVFLTVTLTRPETTANGQLQTVAGVEQNNTLVLPLVQLEGTWVSNEDGSSFVARVDQRTIDIKIFSSDGTSLNYWNGTFETSESPGRSIDSKAVETNEVYLSTAKSKTFSVGADTLAFEFKAMGVTKIVTLKRG